MKTEMGAAAEVVVATTRDELAALANALGEALRAIDEWEFSALVGPLPGRAMALREEIIAIVAAASLPE